MRVSEGGKTGSDELDDGRQERRKEGRKEGRKGKIDNNESGKEEEQK